MKKHVWGVILECDDGNTIPVLFNKVRSAEKFAKDSTKENARKLIGVTNIKVILLDVND